jgi:hypothetical protein
LPWACSLGLFYILGNLRAYQFEPGPGATQLQFMNIYALKNKIKRLELLNDPGQRYWLEFLKDLYSQELAKIANKVSQGLDQKARSAKAWDDHLAR